VNENPFNYRLSDNDKECCETCYCCVTVESQDACAIQGWPGDPCFVDWQGVCDTWTSRSAWFTPDRGGGVEAGS
jgi:hypothetical protein